MNCRGSLFLCMFLLCHAAYSQRSIETIAQHLQKQVAAKPTELMYFQTSKGIYETGEDLWFKGYQLDAQSFGLSNSSKTLYLQMIDHKDSVIWQEKYPIENGIISGHVYIDEKLSEGDYFLKGYTKYSFFENDTTGPISTRKIKIVKNIAAIRGNAVFPNDTTFRFETFPEGGNLVTGIPSKLAFKATDRKGIPVEVEGILYKDGKALNEIKSSHDGMGFLLLHPLKDSKYEIKLKNGNNYPLPNIHAEGMTLQLFKQNQKDLTFILSKSQGLADQQIYLVGQMRGMVCCIAKGYLKENLKIKIPLNNFFYQGIAEFTLFDEAMHPMCERLVYVHPEKKLNIFFEPEKNQYATREKASIHIKVTDECGKPVKVNLGVSIYDQAYNNPEDPVNIDSYCYLSSQIRGNIHNLTYYFNEKNEDRMEALDLLLLTQGWRRYIWELISPPSDGHPFLTDEITGFQTLKNKKKREQNQGSEQLIQISGSNGDSKFVWADSTGLFSVSPEIMNEFRGGYVYLKPMLSKEFKPLLDIKDYFPMIDSLKKGTPNYYPFLSSKLKEKKQILDLPVVSQDSTILLETVTVLGKKGKTFRDKFMGKLDSLAQLNLGGGWVCECQKNPPFLNDYLPGYNHHSHGANVINFNGKKHPPVVGKRYMLIKNNPNGYVEDIKEIIYTGPLYSDEDLLKMNNLWRTKGYYGKREFYQPDETDMQLSIPDARNTLLWAPSIITDEKGEAEVHFYCSDINTVFTGVVEGVDGTGLIGSNKCEFRVMRNIDISSIK